MAYKVTDTVIVDQSRNLSSIGIATFAGPLLIGGGSSTGTVSQPLQVLGTNGAYIGGNLGIGSTNPSSKLSVIGDATFSGIVTSSGLNVRKDPGTGIATDFTNSLFGNGWRLSAPGSTTYYLLATLPTGGGGNTFDHLRIEGTLGAWTNDNQTPFDISFSNRGAFDYKYISYGSVRSDVRIIGISTNSTIQIWAQHQASVFTKLVYNITESIQAIVVSNPTSTTTAPVGTTVFDSSTATPRFIINESDNIGIGTTNPTSKLWVDGNGYFTGIVTANRIFSGVYGEFTGGSISGTNLVGTALSVSGISTFSNGPVFIGSGTSTGTASQPLQVTGGGYFSQSVGIGTTNPTSTLQVQGTVSVSSTTTSAEFVGGGSNLRNLSGTHLVSYASHSETSNSALSIAGISTYNQVGILTGSLAVDASDNFGSSVATSADGKTIIVGAYNDEIGGIVSTGVVYVYDRVGSSFNQVGILTGSLAVDAVDTFGKSVATSADGKTIIVGANNDELSGTTGYGLAYVFDRVGNSFNQVGILTGSLAVDNSDNFGYSVATSADGKTIIVGAYDDEIGGTVSTGVVYVFDRIGNSFNQVGILTGSLAVNASDTFGSSVATSADGKTIIVSAVTDEIGATLSTGVVYVYDRVGSSFNQVGILTGSLAVDAVDTFGKSVATSADGKTIIVGANNDELSGTTGYGLAYVFDRVGNSFNQVGILTGSLAVDASDNFGWSVATSADGKTIIVGAQSDEIGATTGTGIAYVFNRQGNSFNQVGILTGSLAVDASDNFGYSVATSADGKTIVVGAYFDEIGATTSTGVVYVFDQTRQTYVHSGPTGNIGIGTTNPTSALWVGGDGYFTGIVTSSGFYVGGSLIGGSISGTNLVGTALSVSGISTFSNGPVLIGAATSTGTASQLLQVTGGAYVSGSVGIGTTNPFGSNIYSGLDVNSISPQIHARNIGTTTDAGVYASDQDYFSTATYKATYIRKHGTGVAGTIFGSVPYADAGILGFQNTSSGIILTNGQSPLILATFTQERARFDGLTGNMGVGNSNPSFKVDIAGDARVTSTNKMRFGGTSATTNFYIQYNSTTNSLDFVAG